MGEKKSGKDKEVELGQQVSFLRNIAFFRNFDEHELRQFLAVSKWLRISKNALIIQEGTMERAFYILVKGEAQVLKAGKGKKPVVLTTLETGDCFGEMAMVAEIKRSADVRAKKDSFVLRVEPDIISTSNVFLQLKFYKRFCEILVARLDAANRRVAGHRPEELEPSALMSLFAAAGREEPAKAGKTKKGAAKARAKTGGPAGKDKKGKTGALPLPAMPGKGERLTPSKIQKKLRADTVKCVNPAVADELKGLFGAGDATESTRQFAELISLDPVLSYKVIHMANSPIYRRSTGVGTVPHAMVIVGIKNIRQAVAEFIEENENRRAFSGFAAIARQYWRHCVVVGRIAELLKDVIRLNISTDIYLAGLFHDLGVLALDTVSPAFYPQLTRPEMPFADLARAEKEYIGMDHGQAGMWLGESIGLPQAYLDVMRYHHAPEKASTHVLPVALVNLANIFAKERSMGIGSLREKPGAALGSYAWVFIREQHKPFMDTNIAQFIVSFNQELDKAWPSLTGNMPF